MREVLAVTNVMVKVQQDSGSPTMWGDACCVMLSGTMSNVVSAQQMIMERIANIGDRLKEMVRAFGSFSCLYQTIDDIFVFFFSP